MDVPAINFEQYLGVREPGTFEWAKQVTSMKIRNVTYKKQKGRINKQYRNLKKKQKGRLSKSFQQI